MYSVRKKKFSIDGVNQIEILLFRQGKSEGCVSFRTFSFLCPQVHCSIVSSCILTVHGTQWYFIMGEKLVVIVLKGLLVYNAFLLP